MRRARAVETSTAAAPVKVKAAAAPSKANPKMSELAATKSQLVALAQKLDKFEATKASVETVSANSAQKSEIGEKRANRTKGKAAVQIKAVDTNAEIARVHGAGGALRQAQVYGVLRCMISSLDLIDGRGLGCV